MRHSSSVLPFERGFSSSTGSVDVFVWSRHRVVRTELGFLGDVVVWGQRVPVGGSLRSLVGDPSRPAKRDVPLGSGGNRTSVNRMSRETVYLCREGMNDSLLVETHFPSSDQTCFFRRQPSSLRTVGVWTRRGDYSVRDT